MGVRKRGATASIIPFGKHVLTPCLCQTHGDLRDSDAENQVSEQGVQTNRHERWDSKSWRE